MNNIINIIKLSTLYKKRKIKIKLLKKEEKLLNILIKINIIKFIRKNEYDNTSIIFFNYNINNSLFKLASAHKHRCMSLRLNDINKINSKNNIMIISTNNGLLTNYDCYRSHKGGKPVLTLYM